MVLLREDGVVTAHGTKKSVDLATKFTESPWSAKAEVVEAFGEESEHQDKVRDGQVQYQHVGRGTERLETAKDLDDHRISEKRSQTDKKVGQSQEIVSGRVEGLVGMPVRVKERADVFRSVGVQSEAIGHSPWIEGLSLLLGQSYQVITSQVCHLLVLKSEIINKDIQLLIV